jgi:hypothetical protein
MTGAIDQGALALPDIQRPFRNVARTQNSNNARAVVPMPLRRCGEADRRGSPFSPSRGPVIRAADQPPPDGEGVCSVKLLPCGITQNWTLPLCTACSSA